jgi:hypothetical protein
MHRLSAMVAQRGKIPSGFRRVRIPVKALKRLSRGAKVFH